MFSSLLLSLLSFLNFEKAEKSDEDQEAENTITQPTPSIIRVFVIPHERPKAAVAENTSRPSLLSSPSSFSLTSSPYSSSNSSSPAQNYFSPSSSFLSSTSMSHFSSPSTSPPSLSNQTSSTTPVPFHLPPLLLLLLPPRLLFPNLPLNQWFRPKRQRVVTTRYCQEAAENIYNNRLRAFKSSV